MASRLVRRGRGGLRAVVCATVLVVAAGLTACGSSGTPSPAASGGTPAASAGGGVTGTVTVFAASSLTDAFNELGQDFQKANPGSKVTFNYGGSATLAQQIVSGAPADVFASANTTTMQTVVDAKLNAAAPQVFTRNQLEIAVAPGNPLHITSFKDLTKPGLKVVLCDPSQPCGSAAATVEKNTHITVDAVSLAPNVADALSSVQTGDADAAVVYKTDVQSAGTSVTGVDFPESTSAINVYEISVVAHDPNPAAANAFVQFVQSPQGQAVLTKDGFLASS